MKNLAGYLKTTVLLAVLTSFVLGAGYLIAGQSGMQVALLIAIVINGVMYWFSDSIVLKMSQASPLKQTQYPEIFTLTRQLSKKMGVPVPKLFISPDSTPNAFATGRTPAKGVVCLTSGIIEVLSIEELEGVIAHEIAHIKNYDTLTSTVAAVMAGAIATIADMAFWSNIFGGSSSQDSDNNNSNSGIMSIVLLIMSPIVASIIQFAISRGREFEADRNAALTTKKPLNLANALIKIENFAKNNFHQGPTSAPTVSAISIYSNLNAGEGILNLFSTHPKTSERVKRLTLMQQN